MVRRFYIVVIAIVVPILFCLSAGAAQVRAIKGNRLLIELQGSNFNVGDIVKIENSTGQVRALAKVIKVAGRFAEAIYKGRPQQGFNVVIYPRQALQRRLRALRRRREQGRYGHRYGSSPQPMGQAMKGVMLGYNSASGSVKLKDGTTVSLSGTGISLTGFMDHPFRDWFSFRGAAGIDQLNLSGANDPSGCTGSGACDAKITYLSLDLLGRFMHHNLWGGGGVDILFPISKSSTALDTSSISSTMAYMLAAGYDFHFRSGHYMPLELQYQMYPTSSTVAAHAIEFNIGYAF